MNMGCLTAIVIVIGLFVLGSVLVPTDEGATARAAVDKACIDKGWVLTHDWRGAPECHPVGQPR